MTHPLIKAFVVTAALGTGPTMAEDIHVETMTPENSYTSLGVSFWSLCAIRNDQQEVYFPEYCEALDQIDEAKKQGDALCQHDFAVQEAAIDLKAIQEGLDYSAKQELWRVAYDAKESCEDEVRDSTSHKREDAFRAHIGSGLTITLSR